MAGVPFSAQTSAANQMNVARHIMPDGKTGAETILPFTPQEQAQKQETRRRHIRPEKWIRTQKHSPKTEHK